MSGQRSSTGSHRLSILMTCYLFPSYREHHKQLLSQSKKTEICHASFSCKQSFYSARLTLIEAESLLAEYLLIRTWMSSHGTQDKHMNACTRAYKHKHMNACTHAYKHKHMHACIQTHARVHTHTPLRGEEPLSCDRQRH